MSPFLVTLIGAAAAFGTTAAWLPQVIRTWRTRSAKDFDWYWIALFSAGVTLWLVYGIFRRDPMIIIANAVTLLLVTTITVIKWRER